MVTYASKIVQTQDEVPSICKAIHYQKAIQEESPNVWEIEQNVSIRVVWTGCRYIRINASDGLMPASWFALVDGALQAALSGRFREILIWIAHGYTYCEDCKISGKASWSNRYIDWATTTLSGRLRAATGLPPIPGLSR